MQMAIHLSEQALDAGKGRPFGAIIVYGSRIVGSSGNSVFLHSDPTAHAEIMASRDACANLGTSELTDCAGVRFYRQTNPGRAGKEPGDRKIKSKRIANAAAIKVFRKAAAAGFPKKD